MGDVVVRTVEAKSVITKSNLPVCDFSVNPYVGYSHAWRPGLLLITSCNVSSSTGRWRTT